MSRLFAVPQDELTTDDYYTPQWVFDTLALRFDLDVAAPPGGVSWLPADNYFSQEDDGLVQPWSGRVWMNPPYSNSSPWVDRFLDHGWGVALVPHSRSAWWGRLWLSDAGIADGGMFRFHRASTGKLEPVFMPVVFAAFGADCIEAIGRLGRVR